MRKINTKSCSTNSKHKKCHTTLYVSLFLQYIEGVSVGVARIFISHPHPHPHVDYFNTGSSSSSAVECFGLFNGVVDVLLFFLFFNCSIADGNNSLSVDKQTKSQTQL